MREVERIDRITEKLNELWKKTPDWRFFQVLFNYGFLARAEIGRVMDPFNVEDDKIEQHLDAILTGDNDD